MAAMSDNLLFIWGLIAFLFAVGPLSVAAYLDTKEKKDKPK
jgi:hypothetical protein